MVFTTLNLWLTKGIERILRGAHINVDTSSDTLTSRCTAPVLLSTSGFGVKWQSMYETPVVMNRLWEVDWKNTRERLQWINCHSLTWLDWVMIHRAHHRLHCIGVVESFNRLRWDICYTATSVSDLLTKTQVGKTLEKVDTKVRVLTYFNLSRTSTGTQTRTPTKTKTKTRKRILTNNQEEKDTSVGKCNKKGFDSDHVLPCT